MKQYGDFDAYFKCKDMDINFDDYVKPRIMRAIDLGDKDLSGTNNLFTNMCAVVDSLNIDLCKIVQCFMIGSSV